MITFVGADKLDSPPHSPYTGLVDWLLYAGSRFRLPGELSPGRPPLLVLVSEGDTLVHPELSRTLAARLQAPLRSHPRANHDLPLEDPQWVADQVRDWLAGA